jgi:hypothetical protein
MTTENKDEASPSTSGTGMYKVLSFYPSFIICGFLYRLPVLWIRIRIRIRLDPKLLARSGPEKIIPLPGSLRIQNEFEIILPSQTNKTWTISQQNAQLKN